jgi:nitrate reductase assembly molybdenum cofactor insertion protein NarJ
MDVTGSDHGARLLRQAAEWRLLGRLFECPEGEWHHEVAALARELDDADLTGAVTAAADVASAGQYHSVFGPGGPAPPREATYHETLELGSLLSDLARYYDAFGYAPRLQEAPDHVAVEVGFVAYLKLKEAYALAQGDELHAAAAARAAESFIADHLVLLANPLATLLSSSHLDYLARASRLLASRTGPPPPSNRLPMLPTVADEEDAAFECETA